MSGEKAGPIVPPMGIGSEAWDLALGTLTTQLREKYKTDELEKLRIELVAQFAVQHREAMSASIRQVTQLHFYKRIDGKQFNSLTASFLESARDDEKHFDTVDRLINYALNNPFARVR